MDPSRRDVIHALAGLGLASIAGRTARAACDLPGAHIDVQRLVDRPIIHAGLDPSIGTNVQGPTLIRTPDWLPNRLGRYYCTSRTIRGATSGWPMPTTSRAHGRSMSPVLCTSPSRTS